MDNFKYAKKIDTSSVQRILIEEAVLQDPFCLAQINHNTTVNKSFAVVAVVSSDVMHNYQNKADVKFSLSDLLEFNSILVVKNSARNILPEVNSEGIVILLINPAICTDINDKLTLTVDRQKQILVLGHIQKFGRCDALRKDGVSRCKMPLDKDVSEHCIYHSFNGNKSRPVCSSGTLGLSAKPKANASLSRSNTTTQPPRQIVNTNVFNAMNVRPLGSDVSRIEVKVTNNNNNHDCSIGMKRLTSSSSNSDSHGCKRPALPHSNDLLSLALNKALPNKHHDEKRKSSLVASYQSELKKGHYCHQQGGGVSEEVAEDRDDHLFALRRHSDQVNQLLGGTHKPDSAELKTVRAIIEHEQQHKSVATSHSSVNGVNGVKVPAPSSSVFAMGNEMYRQQLREKEIAVESRVNSLPSNQRNVTAHAIGGGGVSQRPMSALGKLGAMVSSTSNTACPDRSVQSTSHMSSNKVSSLSSVGVNKIISQAPCVAVNGEAYAMKSSVRGSVNNVKDNLKLIGNALVDTASLHANANAVSHDRENVVYKGNLVNQIIAHNSNKHSSNNMSANTVKMTTSAVAAVAETGKQKSSLDNTIDALLSRKSINAGSANDEWFESYSSRMQKLAQREYAQEMASSVHSIHIKAFHCHNCNRMTETMPELCRQGGHKVSSVATTKHFFECGICNKRDFTLGNKGSTKMSLPPETRCTMCGGYSWKACGSRGSGPLSVSGRDHKESLHGGKLVLSASEWTTRRDVVNMSVKTSAL